MCLCSAYPHGTIGTNYYYDDSSDIVAPVRQWLLTVGADPYPR
jgi:hypothetical protein